MSDEQGQQPGEAPADEAVALGTWLREAREAAGLGTEAVAAALHLDPDIVTALESESFDTLGAPVFVKGHIRALAGHLELDPAEAIRRYEAAAGESGVRPPDLVVQYQRPIRRNRLGPALLVAIAALLTIALVLAFLLWPERGVGTREPATERDRQTVDSEPVPAADAPRDDAPRDDASRAAGTRAASPASTPGDTDFAERLAAARARTETIPAEAAEPAPEPAVAPSAGLTLSFTGECWFEVRDANGRRLATGTASPGDTRTLDGARPLTVILGVADAVSVTLDGSPYEIPDASRRGRSARLTLR